MDDLGLRSYISQKLLCRIEICFGRKLFLFSRCFNRTRALPTATSILTLESLDKFSLNQVILVSALD